MTGAPSLSRYTEDAEQQPMYYSTTAPAGSMGVSTCRSKVDEKSLPGDWTAQGGSNTAKWLVKPLSGNMTFSLGMPTVEKNGNVVFAYSALVDGEPGTKRGLLAFSQSDSRAGIYTYGGVDPGFIPIDARDFMMRESRKLLRGLVEAMDVPVAEDGEAARRVYARVGHRLHTTHAQVERTIAA